MPARNTLIQLLPLYTPTLRARMHSVIDRRTDRRTDDMMMPIADHTVQQHDRLKTVFSWFASSAPIPDIVVETSLLIDLS